MSRTVTALYDTKAEAEAARQRLASAVDVKSAKVIDQQSQGSGGQDSGGLGEYHLSSDDRHAYGEGIRRGGALLCAEVDGDENSDKIVRLLEETSSVDLDERQESWRKEGWTPYSGDSGIGGGAGRQAATGGFEAGSQPSAGARSGTVEEERIPIVEEELRVGKREVERGGARVRTYVREVPVQEQVTLREEHVQVERRPVEAGTAGASTTSGAAGTGDLLQERTVEMVEKAEEAVVQKVAQVREEVVLTKTAEERTEQISDTVRRTEVDVQEGADRSYGTASTETRSTGDDRSAFGGFGSGGGEGGNR
jgi:stress response protein YsnF